MPDIMLRLGRDVLVAEGAMGTLLQRYGMPAGACPDQFNEIDPETVEQVHRLYHLAGANCAITNTFGATRAKLASFDIEMRASLLNRDGVRLARACRPEHILGDIGPCGLTLAPAGDATFEELFEQYRAQAEALASAEPDAILIETMIDIADARCAVLAARAACDLPVFVTCSFNAQGVMPLSGTSPAAAAVALEACGASAIGINCSFGPEETYPLFLEMARATSLPLIVQPNAGMPTTNRRGEVVYSSTPDDFARWAVRFADAGAAIIGSCCGSTPAFTGAIAAMVGGRAVRPHAGTPLGASLLSGPRKVVALEGSAAPLRIGRVCARFAGDEARDAEAASELASDALDAFSDGAQIVLADVSAEPGSQGRALAALVEAATSSGSPLCISVARAAQLEEALRQVPGRILVDTAALAQSEGGVRKALELAGAYGAMALVRVSSAGPECDADQAIAFIDDAVAAACDCRIGPSGLIIDVASGREGAASVDAMRETLAHVRGIGALASFDVTASRKSLNPAKRLRLLSEALSEGIDVVIYDIDDEACIEALG